MFRFIHRAKKSLNKSVESNSLTADELLHAQYCVIWIVQQQFFAEEIRLLTANLCTQGALKNLNPFLHDVEGFLLLKVGGRLANANIAEGQKHPILLPNKCTFTHNYVRYLHQKNYHAGPKALVALIRRNFWIVNA